MALDYGKARIGVAVTNPEQTMVFAHKVIDRTRRLQPLLDEIQRLISEWAVKGIVIGYPLNADGSAGRMCQAALQFAHHIHRITPAPILLADERYTSDASADDAAAAKMILQDVLKI